MPDNNTSESVSSKVSGFISSIKAADANEIKIFESFLAELTDDDDAPPIYACRDAKYYLTLQREKMKSLGISVEESINKAGALEEITGVVFDSPCYTGHRLFKEYLRKSKYSLNGKRIYTHKDKQVLYQTLIHAKRGLPHKASYICPNCGAMSHIDELESGCKYCGTRFLMSELFPKVVGHYWLRGYSMGKGEMGKRVLSFILGGLIIGIAAGGILDLTGIWSSFYRLIYPEDPKVSSTLFLGLMGLVTGAFLSTVTLFFKVMIDAVKSLPLISRVAGSKKIITESLKKRDPYFFYEAFESRVLSLLEIMLYGKNLSENAAYCGNRPVPPSDVIEAVYRGAMEVLKIELSGNYTLVTLSVFADCLHLKGRRIFRKNDEYRMVIVRNSATVTDQGFSIIKVECPSCGGSFDATRTKRCPHCGRDYRLYDYDWAVLSIEKIK